MYFVWGNPQPDGKSDIRYVFLVYSHCHKFIPESRRKPVFATSDGGRAPLWRRGRVGARPTEERCRKVSLGEPFGISPNRVSLYVRFRSIGFHGLFEAYQVCLACKKTPSTSRPYTVFICTLTSRHKRQHTSTPQVSRYGMQLV